MNISEFINLFNTAAFSFIYQKIYKIKSNNIQFEYIFANKSFLNLINEAFEFNTKESEDIYKKYLNIEINWNEVNDYFESEFYSAFLNSFLKVRIIAHKNNEYSVYVEKINKSTISLEHISMDILKISHEGIAIIQDNKFVFFNQALKKIFSYTENELYNININKLVHSVDPDNLIFGYESNLGDSYVEPYQFKVLDKNNKTKWLAISTSNFKWNNQEAALCFISDVTKKKEMEDALRESERKKNLLIKGMNNLIFILDYDFKFLDYYSSGKGLFLKEKEFLEKSIYEIDLPKKVLQKILYALNNTKKSSKDSQVEYALNINGEKVWFEMQISTIYDEVINKVEFLCVVKDITKLKESEREIKAERDLFSDGPVMTIVWSCYSHWTIKKISSNVKKLLGYEAEELLDPSFKYPYIVYKEDRERVTKELDYYFDNRIDSFEQSYRLKNKDGEYHWFYDFTKVIRDLDENIIEIRGYLFNQNHIKKIEEQLMGERERLQNIIKGTRAGTWEWDIENDKILIDSRWAEILGYTLDELKVLNKNKLKTLMNGEDYSKNEDLLKKHFLKKIPYYENEFRVRHKNKNWVWVSAHGEVLKWSEEGKPLLMFGIQLDITEKKKVEERILEASIRDPLTNLYNRRYIFDRLNIIKSQYIRQREVFSIAIIDLDFFKNVNDNYGHVAGDFILQEFSRILNNSFRAFDLIGRYGGEEFIVVMTSCEKEIALKRIEGILEEIREKEFLYEDSTIKITFSSGIADSEEFEDIILDKFIDLADQKLYKAKQLGRNTVIC